MPLFRLGIISDPPYLGAHITLDIRPYHQIGFHRPLFDRRQSMMAHYQNGGSGVIPDIPHPRRLIDLIVPELCKPISLTPFVPPHAAIPRNSQPII